MKELLPMAGRLEKDIAHSALWKQGHLASQKRGIAWLSCCSVYISSTLQSISALRSQIGSRLSTCTAVGSHVRMKTWPIYFSPVRLQSTLALTCLPFMHHPVFHCVSSELLLGGEGLQLDRMRLG